MNDEIKEILDRLDVEEFELPEYASPIAWTEMFKIRDYITNLQEELEDLKEDNYAYHQLMKMQNKREYRSKFLKEFQEEFGTNTFPDYDEIYKRYDKLKKENEKLLKKSYSDDVKITKAIEYMNNYIELEDAPINERIKIEFKEVIKLLNGGDKE